ncbi:hypothetical protein MRX96_056970 [Rhipicephalus microplus]
MMFALVRFVEEKTDKRYVIPVADIKYFEPQNDLDFDNMMPYDAYWHDEEDDENSGIYAVQILKLAVRILFNKGIASCTVCCIACGGVRYFVKIGKGRAEFVHMGGDRGQGSLENLAGVREGLQSKSDS